MIGHRTWDLKVESSSPGRCVYVVFLLWGQPDKILGGNLRWTSRNTPSRFIQQIPEISTGTDGPLARLLHKLPGYLSKVSPNICKSCSKVAHFTNKLLKSCFLSTKKNQFLLLMKVNLCTSKRVI